MKHYTYIIISCIFIFTTIIAYIKYKEEVLEKQKEQAILNYYQDVETLLDSLCIDCGDTIFETDAGAKYLESKYTFDSLFISNDRRN